MNRFDRLIAEAWPTLEAVERDGFLLRSAGGVTKRANSAWATGDAADIAAAEDFYVERGLAPTFWINGDADLDARLARRGYDLVDPTLIMAAPLSHASPPEGLEIADEPSPEWLDVWWSVDGRYESGLKTAQRILTGVPAVYATLGDGVGRAVHQGEWVSVWCMATAPEARRQGIARRLLTGLLSWGAAVGATRAYLLVVEANAAARALYEGAGFSAAGGYHYRVGQNRTK